LSSTISSFTAVHEDLLRLTAGGDAGGGYASVGSMQLLSVPYALYAAQSGSGGTLPAGTSGQTLRHDGTDWVANDLIHNNGTTVGIGTNAPAAFLDMNSTANGVLFPRMSTSQRDAIPSPAQSLVIFNTTTNCFETYIGGLWQRFFCGCTSPPAFAPMPGTHTVSVNWILYTWSSVPGATGYKWNTIDDLLTATDIGQGNSLLRDSLDCSATDTMYLWAYNECGHSPLAVFSATTNDCPCGPQTTFIDARDSTVYMIVNIGAQCWMKENLRYDQSSFGNAYQHCYDPPTCSNYEMFYDWDAAMQGSAPSYSNPSGVQGICPAGWHLPSQGEWAELEAYLGGAITAGGKMKEIGHWFAPNTGATNSSEFSALPKGYFQWGNNYGSGMWTYYWSTGEFDMDYAWSRHLTYDSEQIMTTMEDKLRGVSIRCVKD
jgi:uncharacterized protein (TIGR02145 family)